MICPSCKDPDTRVLDSRDSNEGRVVRRRRECAKCVRRFTTFERIETTNLIVIKKDGSREAYNREKLERGIWRSCEKRPVRQEQIDKMLNELEEQWGGLGKEIESQTIGEGVMEHLRKIDEVAYIRFASVYRQFKDLESFKQELAKLLE